MPAQRPDRDVHGLPTALEQQILASQYGNRYRNELERVGESAGAARVAPQGMAGPEKGLVLVRSI